MSRVDEARALLSAQHHEDYPITTAALLALVEDLERERDTFASIIDEGPDCLPGCDSIMHEDLCPNVNPREAWADLERRLAEAAEVLTYYATEPEDRIYDMGHMADKWLERNQLGDYAPAPPAPEEP